MNVAMFILFRYLEFPPNHLIYDPDVTLDYLHDLRRDVLIDVVWNWKAILTILAKLHGGVYGLEKGFLIDACYDKIAFVDGFRTLG